MKVMLYRVGRNLNRAYRTCEAFGVDELELLECDAKIVGNLFRAKDRVMVSVVESFPLPNGLLALETSYLTLLSMVDWTRVDTILLGGESYGLPCIRAEQKAHIETVGLISGLTVEATLAIALYQWSLFNRFVAEFPEARSNTKLAF